MVLTNGDLRFFGGVKHRCVQEQGRQSNTSLQMENVVILKQVLFFQFGIKKNTGNILIPSEEHKISMYRMGFEEFLWAIEDEMTSDTIRFLLAG